MRKLSLRPGPILALLVSLLCAGSASRSEAQTYNLGPGDLRFLHTPLDTTVNIQVRPLGKGIYAAKISYVWTGWVELSDGGILVVDTGFSEGCGRALADTIRARSGKKPIRYVVNTNAHEDHTGGDRYFGALGATFIAHETAADEIAKLLAWVPGESGDTLSRLGIKVPMKRVARKMALGGAARPVQIAWLGKAAHTAGDLIVRLPKQHVLFAGDLVWSRAVPWLLDPGLNVSGWLATLDTLATPTFTSDSIVPGHGVMMKASEEVGFTARYLNDARDKASTVAAWGTTLNQVRDWGYLGAYEGLEFYEEVHFMNMRRLYNEAKGIKTPGRRNVRVLKHS